MERHRSGRLFGNHSNTVSMLVWVMSLAFIFPLPSPSTANQAGCSQLVKRPNDVALRFRFEGGPIDHNIASFYQFLVDRGSLACQTLSIDKNGDTVGNLLLQKHVLVNQYPTQLMNPLLCQLNPQKCNGIKFTPYQKHDSFKVPAVSFEEYSSISEVAVNPGEQPSKNLRQILARAKLLGYWIPKSQRQQILLDTRLRNADFVTPFYRSQNGIAQEIIYANRPGYKTSISLPPEVAQESEALKQRLLLGPAYSASFYVEVAVPVHPLAMSDQSFVSTVKPSSDSVAFSDMMSEMNANVSNLQADGHVSLLIADEQIETDNAYFTCNGTVATAKLPSGLDLAAPSTCRQLHHGTFMTGVLCADILPFTEGLSRRAHVSFFDFTKPPANGEDFADFLQDPAQLGVGIINISLGAISGITNGPFQSIADDNFRKIVTRTPTFLYVISAGNDGQKLDDIVIAPLNVYTNPTAIIVGALDHTGSHLLDMSNRGSKVVQIAAPGEDIPGICSGSELGTITGTSPAAALVSGAAAIVEHEGLTEPKKVKVRLLYTADILPNLDDDIWSGRLDVTRLLSIHDDLLCSLTDFERKTDRCSVQPTLGDVEFYTWQPSGFHRITGITLGIDFGGRIQLTSPLQLLRLTRSGNDGLWTVFYLEHKVGEQPTWILKKAEHVRDIMSSDDSRPVYLKQGNSSPLMWSATGDFVRGTYQLPTELEIDSSTR